MKDLVFYTNHAGAIAVSIEGWTDGYIFLPSGRVIAQGYPWVEADEDLEAKLTDAQRERVLPLLEDIEEKREFRDKLAREILAHLGKSETKGGVDVDALFPED